MHNQGMNSSAVVLKEKTMDDLISRQAALDAMGERPLTWTGGDYELGCRNQYDTDRLAIETVPSAQPWCEDAVSREAVLNEIHRYMEERDYTIGLLDDNVCGLPSVTPKQPGWIPCSTALPEYDGEYLVTKKSFGWNCKEYIETDIARYEKKDGWHKADTVLAWCELPTPYREGGQDGKN